MSTPPKTQESMELQLKNLENQNKILRLKMQEQKNSGKFFNDLYSLLEGDKNTHGDLSEENPIILKMK